MKTSREQAKDRKKRNIQQTKELAKGLRALAAFLVKHPNLGRPLGGRFDFFVYDGDGTMSDFARAFGDCEKVSDETYFILRKEFGGGVKIEANWHHEEVCERVVTGTEEVEETVPVAFEKRMVTREKVEWRCPSVLAPKKEGAQ